MLDDLTISNGVGWSPDGRTMYLVDSGPRVVHAFAFDAERGEIADGRVLVTVPETVGSPDGMTVDAAGDLWVAIYGGGAVQALLARRPASPGTDRPGAAEHLLRVRRAGPPPALRHHRHRELDRRATQGRAGGRARVPAGHRRHRPAGGSVQARSGWWTEFTG